MIEDLDEHLLIALAARVNGSFESNEDGDDEDLQRTWNMSNWLDIDVKSMKENVVPLMEAAGESASTQDASPKSFYRGIFNPSLLVRNVGRNEKSVASFQQSHPD